MTEQRNFVLYENDLLIFFWGLTETGEIVGIVSYVSRLAPTKSPNEPRSKKS